MTTGTKLLNDDGTASMATALMMSHHAFRRDLARFRKALAIIAAGDVSRAAAVQDEWTFYRGALHGHHTIEDTALFPDLARKGAAIAGVIERLSADHRRIDPLLEAGDRAFAALPRADEAASVVAELEALLDAHLAFEEAEVVSFVRDAKEFPAPEGDDQVNLYAQGFAWSSHGIAPDVLAQVDAMLPEPLRLKLPAARREFAARCERVWGTARAGASHTSVPDDVDR